MGLRERVDAARRFDPNRFLRFVTDGATLGHVRRDLASHLAQFHELIEVDGESVAFRAHVADAQRRSDTMAMIAQRLAAAGLLSAWRNETYDIRAVEGGPALFKLERAAVRFFGFTARAVHVNGIVEDGEEGALWIARRSPTKAIDPDMLDTMVGGGLATNLSIEETLVKEAWEEAGIPAALAGTARAAGSVRVIREVPQGLHVEINYVYDLVLPRGFTPRNQDGEVAEFRCLRQGDVLLDLASDAPYTVDAGLVTLDCLVRRGLAEWPGAGAGVKTRD